MKTKAELAEAIPFAILLTLSGGLMDAYSYLCRDNVFANAQTGNILLMGVHLSEGEWLLALRYFCPIIAFAGGIALAEAVKHRFAIRNNVHWQQLILLMETAILLFVSTLGQNWNLLANSLTSFACGAQVESFRKVQGYGAATTMCIGNLRTAVESVCTYHYGGNRLSLKKGMLFFGIIGVFAVGAVIGKYCVQIWGERGIVASSLLLTAACVMQMCCPDELETA